jgi:photosystem II stability/assembly factor-like uncharacterized protein
MKKVIKKFWGIALIVVMLSTLFIAATPTAAADPLKWNYTAGMLYFPGAFYTQFPNTDIADFAVSADGMTFYAAIHDTFTPNNEILMKGTFGGGVWADLTSGANNRLQFTDLDACDFVAMSPDNPDVIVVLDAGGTDGNIYAAVSKDGGLNFSDMGAIEDQTGDPIAIANDLDVSPVTSRGVYYVAIAGVSLGGEPAVYYYNFGAAVGAWNSAVTDFPNVKATGLTPPWWAAGLGGALPITEFFAVEFSPNFASDFTVAAVSEDPATAMYLHLFSLNSCKWDTDLNLTGYPVPVYTDVAGVAVNAASIAMGPDFVGIDEETLMTFVGASIVGTDPEDGAIFRVDETNDVTAIKDGFGMYSIDYDGTTVIAGSYLDNIVYRVLEPLANQPTAASSRNMKRIGINDMGGFAPVDGYNDMVIVHIAGANVFGAKSGDASALSKSTDNGNTWNDFTLMDSTNTVMDDVYLSPDGSTYYFSESDWDAVTLEGEASVYRQSGPTLQRVLCVDMTTLGAAPQFMLRGIPGDANVIYAADKSGGSVDIYVSTDGGTSRWSRKTNYPGVTLDDLAVESASVVYGATGVFVYKSTNSGSLWDDGTDTKITVGIFNMISLGDGKLVIGGWFGGVEFSTDGGATWTPTFGVAYTNAADMGPTYVAATGLGPTDYIFAAPAFAILTGAPVTNVYRSPAAFFGVFKDMKVPAIGGGSTGQNSGIVYTNGILYVLESSAADGTYLIHNLTPTAAVPTAVMWGTRYPQVVGANAYVMNSPPGSALKATVTGTTIKLWGIDTVSRYIYSYDDIVSLPKPILSAPADKEMIDIVSPMLADAGTIVFSWKRADPQITNYQLLVAKDAAFNELIIPNAGDAGIVPSGGPTDAVSIVYGRSPLFPLFNPGETYYWMVSALIPFNGAWSEVRTFTIAPSAATVPQIASPANGAANISTTPSFSWSPVTGTTKYEFQLSKDATFATPLVSQQLATTAIQPTGVTLEAGKTYFWRVKALEPIASDWSAIANFTVAVPATPPPPPVTVNVSPPPTINITQPAAPIITVPLPADKVISPAYIWAIIIIGAVLVIAVIVLIVRTRRSV